jgi:hypothetical protein
MTSSGSRSSGCDTQDTDATAGSRKRARNRWASPARLLVRSWCWQESAIFQALHVASLLATLRSVSRPHSTGSILRGLFAVVLLCAGCCPQTSVASAIVGQEVVFVASASWTVPNGIHNIRAHVWGSAGCRTHSGTESETTRCGAQVTCKTPPFAGGYASATSSVTPGQSLSIIFARGGVSIPELSLSATKGSDAYFAQNFIVSSTQGCYYVSSGQTGSSGGPAAAPSSVTMYSGNSYAAGQPRGRYCTSLPASGLAVIEWQGSSQTMQGVPSGLFLIPAGSWSWAVPPGMGSLRFHAIAANGCFGSEFYGWSGWSNFGSHVPCPGSAGGRGGRAVGEVQNPTPGDVYSFSTSGGTQTVGSICGPATMRVCVCVCVPVCLPSLCVPESATQAGICNLLNSSNLFRSLEVGFR